MLLTGWDLLIKSIRISQQVEKMMVIIVALVSIGLLQAPKMK